MSSTAKLTRTSLTIEQKVQIIKRVEQKIKQNVLAKEYNVTESTISRIVKEKDKILRHYSEGLSSASAKRLRHSNLELLDKVLLLWFQEQRAAGNALSGPLILEKAAQLAADISNNPNTDLETAAQLRYFKASSGFLTCFKSRHGISCKAICGESGAVSVDAINQWSIETLPSLLRRFKPRDVFNADQTGLFYRMTPDRTLAYKNDKCHGGKRSKERVTVMLCTNMDGSERLPLEIVGKYQSPRCLKGVNRLPVVYRSNNSAWWNRDFTKQFLLKLDRKMKAQGRKVLLILDNFSGHQVDLAVSNIEIHFLPPNTTSKTQPLDMGIIQNFKVHYRKRLLRRLVAAIDANKGCDFLVTLKDAIDMSAAAWKEVLPSTISACYRKAGFVIPDSVSSSPINDGEVISLDDCLQDTWSIVKNYYNLSNDTFLGYAFADNDVLTFATMTEAEIVRSVHAEHDAGQNGDEDEIPDDEVDPILEEPRIKNAFQAMQCLGDLRAFFNNHAGYSENIREALDCLEDFVGDSQRSNAKQKTITDFFSVGNML